MSPTTSLRGSKMARRKFLKGAVVAGAALSFGGALTSREASSQPRKGGRLRVAQPGGGASETLNVNHQKIEIDTMRAFVLFETLVGYAPNGRLFNKLVEEFSPSKDASVWKVKLRSDVVFHNGKPLTADDVVYTFRYILDPANTATGRPFFSSLFRPNDIRSLDRHTFEVKLLQPLAILPEAFSSQQYGVFPEGTKTWDPPIGTGPFKFKSWTPGERSLFVRNEQYRIHNGPYLDELEIISINESGARFNALVGGQVDAVPRLTPALVSAVKSNPQLRLVEGPTGVHTDFYMACDLEPFRDNRVREAFRLMVDRQQLVQNALSGHGKIGNDLPTPFDADYASSIPQRPHDPEKARALLKAAGHENLTVSLYTADAGPAMIESATLFVEHARAAGVTVQLNKVPGDQYYNEDKFMKTPFQMDTWSFRLLSQAMADGYVSKAPFNESHWYRPEFDRLVRQAEATLDSAKRRQLWFDVQKELWDQGGYIIWGFINNLDGVSAKLRGLKESVTRPLGRYDLTDAYFA